jgi:glutathione S-transferase
MAEIAVYAAPGSCARVTMTALEHIGVPFEYRLVRPMIQETRTPEYLAMNPKGKVPVLIFNGEALTENVAIISFLAHQFPKSRLLPATNDAMGAMRQLADLCFCSSTLHPVVTRIRNPHFFADSEEAKLQVRKKAIDAMRPNFDLVKNRVRDNQWWYGAEWSAMDGYVYWAWSRSIDVGFPAGDYPEIGKFAQRMEGLDSVRKMLKREADAEQQLRKEGHIK